MQTWRDHWIDELLEERRLFQGLRRTEWGHRDNPYEDRVIYPSLPRYAVSARTPEPIPEAILLTSTTRSNQAGHTGPRHQTTHQRQMHQLVMSKGYRFKRGDAASHNIYENDYGQHITVPGTPRSDGNSRRAILQEIRRHDREREGNVTTTTGASVVDQMVALAGDYLMKPPKDNSKATQRARSTAIAGWLKRVLERHGPVATNTVKEAAERLGIPPSALQNARAVTGTRSISQGNTGGWLMCLPHQVPADRNATAGPQHKDPTKRAPQSDVEPEQAERPPTPNIVRLVPNLHGEDQDGTRPGAAAALVSSAFAEPAQNGKRELTEQQAALLLMAESLGLQLPGESARLALVSAQSALRAAQLAVENAMEALS